MKPRHSIAAAAALILIAAPALAKDTAPAPTVDTIVSSLTARMDAVAAYQARVHLNIHMHSFPFLIADLDGTTTYARPGKYSVTFDSLPALASAFQKVSGDIGDPAAWKQKYNVALDTEDAAAQAGTLVLRLSEKIHGQVDHALAYVDMASNTVTRMEWYYYSGGRIAMEQHFSPVDGVLLVDSQAADIDMPGYRATAQAVFNGYNVQVSMNPSAHPAAR